MYNGGIINNTIKQSQHDLDAAKEDANMQFQNIALQMASAYLNVLLSEEQVTIARKAIDQTREQLSQIDKRIEAGTVPRADDHLRSSSRGRSPPPLRRRGSRNARCRRPPWARRRGALARGGAWP